MCELADTNPNDSKTTVRVSLLLALDAPQRLNILEHVYLPSPIIINEHGQRLNNIALIAHERKLVTRHRIAPDAPARTKVQSLGSTLILSRLQLRETYLAHVEVGVWFGFLVRVEDFGAWAADVGGTGEVVFAVEACLCRGWDEEAALV
jgi:hypothetical protein